MDDVETHFKRSADRVILNNASLKVIRQVLTRGELLFTRDERQSASPQFKNKKSTLISSITSRKTAGN
jgi:hypothetical protein